MRLSTLWRPLALPLLVALLAGSAQAQTTFSNTAAIAIPGTGTAAGPASPYPSPITVSGVGTVTDVNVTLNGVSHAFPDDIDVLLVGPNGTRLIVMSDVGGLTAVTNLTLALDDAAGALLPDNSPLVSGTFKPTNIGAGDTFPTGAPTTGTLATTLAGYNGISADGVWSLYVTDDANGDVGSFSGGWSITFNTPPPTNPAFTLATTGTAFGTATACSVTPGAEHVFTVSNTGGGAATLTVSSITFTGTGAANFTTEGATTPFSLAAGASKQFVVRFAPAVGATAGSSPASVVITYTGATGSPSTTAVTATVGTAVNTSAGIGDGYEFGSSNTACSPPVPGFVFTPIPFGTAAGDLQATPFVGGSDDGSFRVDLTAAMGGSTFGPFRLFSKPYSQLFINTNGNLFFDQASTGIDPVPAPGTLTRNARIAAFATDLDLRTAGQVFYGVRDLNADGIAEFVVTYYRVPIFGGGTSKYVTFQVILGQPTTPGGNGTVLVQYYSGIDPTDNRPFTLGAANNDGSRVGLYGDQGFMSAIYRTFGTATVPSSGGPTFGGGNLAVGFRPRGEQILGRTYAGAGWRQLTHGPGGAMDVADLAEQNLVQGITNEYATTAPGPDGSNDNLLTEYDFATAGPPAGFAAPAARATALTGGKGLFWYFYDTTFDPSASTASGVGSSESFTLPNPLLTAGTRRTADVTTTIDAAADGAFRYEMLGNPFEGNFDMTQLIGAGGTPSNVAQSYNPTSPTTGTYVLSSTTGNRVALWQGFFLDVGVGTTAVTFPIAGVTPTATPFQGFGEAPPQEATVTAESRLVAFRLTGQTPDGTPTVDEAAAVYFSGAAGEGWDSFDAGKLTPFGPYAVLAFAGERNGQAVLKSQESRALDAASFDVPLVVEAVGTAPGLTLRWDQVENVPETWGLTLRDLVTGTVVDLRTATEYTFEVVPSGAAPTPTSVMTVPSPSTLTVDPARGATAQRFVLHVETRGATAGEGEAITEFALAAPAPNPTTGAARISFDVPTAGTVSVAVYDLLGRRVAVLAQGEVAVGRHEVRLDAGALAPGVYVVRMQSGTFMATQRVTVVR